MYKRYRVGRRALAGLQIDRYERVVKFLIPGITGRIADRIGTDP